MRDVDLYFLQHQEPNKSCLLALRDIVLQYDPAITLEWKYRMPFFCYHGKMFAYLWTHKKNLQPYLGIVDGNKIDHPMLIHEKRARIKILLIDPAKDIPIKTIRLILKNVLALYK